MAYMSQEKKAVIAAELKKVMPKGWKYSLGVRHHSTVVLKITSAPVDLLAGLQGEHAADIRARRYHQVNAYHLGTQFSGEVLKAFEAIRAALNTGNWDRSDLMSDYCDVGHYVDIQIGRWDKPFEVLPRATATAEVANWLDPSGALQAAGLLEVQP